MVGRTISNYRILSSLGAGGMGEVYLAQDLRLGRRVALKILPRDVGDDAERLARFEREARAVAALNHPNIVTLHAVGEAEGLYFLTMEFVEGRTLGQIIQGGTLPLDQVLDIAVPLADALAAVHEHHIVHRDLKPGNVMLTDDGRVKVLDFGLAKLLAPPAESRTDGATEPPSRDTSDSPTHSVRATELGTILGTLVYMAPEQVQGRPADARSDIFAFGILLYEMLTGARPFRGTSAADVMSAILRDTPSPVTAVRPEVPPELERVVRRCLEKDPRRRYQSALDLRNDLEELAAARGSPTTQTVRTPAPAARLRGGRRRTVAMAAAVVAAAIVVGAAVGAWYFGGRQGMATTDRSIRSLAVLPFDNLMQDPDQDYFVDGMQETLITTLSKIQTLRVISRTSVMRYRNRERPLPEIARELGVDGLIEGSVLRVGNRVRVTAQLIDGASDQHLWANSYDRDVRDVLGLMSDVAHAISGEVEVALTPQEATSLARARALDPRAQDAYLRARAFLSRFSPEAAKQALAFSRQALDIDPALAEAHGTEAMAYVGAWVVGVMPPKEASQRAREAAERALSLDDELGDAHGAMGYVRLYFDWDWDAARRSLERALELSPNNALIRHGYADYLLVMGRHEDSLAQVELGRQYDPMSPVANAVVVGHLMFSRRWDEVLAESRRILGVLPEMGALHGWIGDALWRKGQYEEAMREYRAIPSISQERLAALEQGFRTEGPRGARRAEAAYLIARSASSPASPLEIASAYALAGDADPAFEWLQNAYEVREPMLVHLRASPDFDSLHGDPRFAALLHQIGFPE